jgi:hypothetical protein
MKTRSAYFSKPIFFIVCQLQKKENNEENIKEDFSALTKSYFDGKCARPLWCNTKWSNEYNDQLQRDDYQL